MRRLVCSARLGIALLALLLHARPAAAAPCGRVRFVTVYDSHGLTTFGDRLDAWILGQKGAELESFTLGGATTEWLVTEKVSIRGYHYHSCNGSPLTPRAKLPQQKVRAPTVDALFPERPGAYERQVVLVTLGSNMPGDPAAQMENVAETVRRIRSRPNAICIWIGPPSMRKWSSGFGDKVYAALREGIAAAGERAPGGAPACHLVDSRKLSMYPDGGDGWHYGFFPAGVEAATRWADNVTDEITRIVRAWRPPPSRPERGTRTPPFWRPIP